MSLSKKIKEKFGIPAMTLYRFKNEKETNWRKKLYNFFEKYENYVFTEKYDVEYVCPYCNNEEQLLIQFNKNKIMEWDYRMQILYYIIGKPWDLKIAMSDYDNNLFCTQNYDVEAFTELFINKKDSKLYKKYEIYLKNLKKRRKKHIN